MRNTSAAGRRYVRRFIPMILAYAAALVVSIVLMQRLEPQGPLLALLAVLPALPLLGLIAVLGIYVAEETDEYVRANIVRHMLIGLAALLGLLTVWGFLEMGRAAPHFPTILAFPVWCGVWGFSQSVAALRARIGGDA